MKYSKATSRGISDAINDLQALDRELRHGKGATNANIRRQKRQIYQFISKQGINIDDVINNKRRVK